MFLLSKSFNWISSVSEINLNRGLSVFLFAEIRGLSGYEASRFWYEAIGSGFKID